MSVASVPVPRILNDDRLVAWLHVLAVLSLIVALGYVALSRDGLDPMGKIVGTDFASFYAASKLALAGHASDAYVPARHAAEQAAILGQDVGYAAFFYPPLYLLYCLPLGLMPYAWALLLWSAATLAAYMCVMRAAKPRLGWMPILAFPAVLVTLGHGQNALLSTALLGGALAHLERRPAFAGVLIGALAYKPQLGIALPFLLLAMGNWVALASAAGTVLALTLAATAAFSADIWPAFLASTAFASATLEQGLVGYHKMVSVYAGVRLAGGPSWVATGLQAVVTAMVIAGLMWAAARAPRRDAIGPLTALTICLASPFLLDYDLCLLAIPLIWLALENNAQPLGQAQRALALLAFMLPLLARMVAQGLLIPLAPLVLAAFYVFILDKAFEGQLSRAFKAQLRQTLGTLAAPANSR